MTLQPPRRLARFVEPDVDDKRVDRVWASIGSRRLRPWPVWRMTAFAGAAAVAAVLVVLLRPRQSASDLAGVVLESGLTKTMTLPDGSSVLLRDRARLRYDRVQSDRVEATVERGEVVFEVRHSDSRVFVVHAAAFDVIDRGTRFVVGVDGESVHVAVETGSVDIARGSEAKRTLGGGESWTSGSTAALPVQTEPPLVGAPPLPDPLPATDPSGAAPSALTAESARVPPSSSPGARELLQAADDARLAGHTREAASAFDNLRRHYRSDPRAGLAAFELGRLRLDSLGDPGGAAEAFTDSITLAPGATFREDAEARLVEALDRAHDAGRCAAARRAYLARFPHGLHAASVAARCP